MPRKTATEVRDSRALDFHLIVPGQHLTVKGEDDLHVSPSQEDPAIKRRGAHVVIGPHGLS